METYAPALLLAVIKITVNQWNASRVRYIISGSTKSAWILLFKRPFFARLKICPTWFSSHQFIIASRQKPLSPRIIIFISFQCAWIRQAILFFLQKTDKSGFWRSISRSFKSSYPRANPYFSLKYLLKHDIQVYFCDTFNRLMQNLTLLLIS